MNVDRAKQIARAEISQYPGSLRRLSARVLADECDRLEVRLESVRLELAATVANIAAWDDVLADVTPALRAAMEEPGDYLGGGIDWLLALGQAIPPDTTTEVEH